MASPAFDSMQPPEIVSAATEAGAKKAKLPIDQMLLRGALSGLILGIATSLALLIGTQPFGLQFPLMSAAFFPVGFVMLVILGCELVTGNLALIPMAVYAGKANTKDMLNNWFWVTLGNLLGSLIYAFLFWGAFTRFGMEDSTKIGVGQAAFKKAEVKTLDYEKFGMQGWLAALTTAILCNWMVTMGTIMNFTSKSLIGRIVAMWLPIMVFFAHGYEHAVVNFFVIPAGMFFGANVNVLQWWFWNQIPVLIGNLIGGCFLTGLPLAYAFPVPREQGALLAELGQAS